MSETIPLRQHLLDMSANQTNTTSELQSIENQKKTIRLQRDAAMRAAAEPFEQQIRDLDGQATRVRAIDPGTILRSPSLSHNVRIPLQLEAERTFGGSVDALVDEYVESLKDTPNTFRRYRAPRTLARIAQFETFMSELETADNDVTFAAAALDWSEVRDAQADAEGRDASTGNYVRTGSVFVGDISIDDIMTRRSYDERGSLYYEGIDISATRLNRIDTQLDWMYFEETNEERARHTQLTLFGPQNGNSFGDRQTIEWDLSNQANLSQPEFTYRPGYLANGYVREQSRIIAWGEGADRLLNLIVDDQFTAHSMARAVRGHLRSQD